MRDRVLPLLSRPTRPRGGPAQALPRRPVAPREASDEREKIGDASAYWYKRVIEADGSAEGWVYVACLRCRLATAEPALYGLAIHDDETKGAAPAFFHCCFGVQGGRTLHLGCFLDSPALPASLFRFSERGGWEGSTMSLFAAKG
ncbi:MAG TPA: hypothetical protein PLB91_08310 [Spirochaetales bacterium]|nr:hypothetical protein [Spirochaetales bacterium]HRY53278.1 hypothetical protein [Spirochaetia bacterium]HRZ64479.1 hypothetical protein [Spirochaetia bacterium]